MTFSDPRDCSDSEYNTATKADPTDETAAPVGDGKLDEFDAYAKGIVRISVDRRIVQSKIATYMLGTIDALSSRETSSSSVCLEDPLDMQCYSFSML